MQSVCVSYHKAREVGSGEALQGEGIHKIRNSRGWGVRLEGVGRDWELQAGTERGRKGLWAERT